MILSKYSLANASGLPMVINWLNRRRLLVLTYHGIYDGPRGYAELPPTFIHINDMVTQLIAVKKRYIIVSPDDVYGALETGKPLPNNSALITYDDGYESFERLAKPVLDSFGIRALVFVSTYFVETQKPFWFDLVWFFWNISTFEQKDTLKGLLQISNSTSRKSSLDVLNIMKKWSALERDAVLEIIEKELRQKFADRLNELKLFCAMTQEQIEKIAHEGTSIGGHTHTHSILATISDSEIEQELKVNKEKLEEYTGHPCLSFAYPNGGRKDFTENHKTLLKKIGYGVAFSLTYERSNPENDPMEVGRINAVPEDSAASLLFKCSGITPVINRFRKSVPETG